MTRPMTCIRCGSTELIRNPIHTHWLHCPACEPVWAEYSKRINRLSFLDSFASAAANDKRGRPTIGGSRSG